MVLRYSSLEMSDENKRQPQEDSKCGKHGLMGEQAKRLRNKELSTTSVHLVLPIDF